MSDEFVIKRKLICDGDGTGEDKKIITFSRLLPKFIFSDDTASSEAAYSKLLAQLASIVTSRQKVELTRKSNVKHLMMFNTLQTTYQERLTVIREDIKKQRDLLRRAKAVKQNYVEYDLLRQTVNKECSRKETSKKIERVKKEIKNLEKKKQNLHTKLDSRVKQCYVLSTSANTLKGILQADNVDWENQMDVSSTNSESSELDMQVTVN